MRDIYAVPVRGSRPEWRKSRASASGGDCVELAFDGSSVWIRDSRDKAGPVLVVKYARWRDFVDCVRDGELTGD